MNIDARVRIADLVELWRLEAGEMGESAIRHEISWACQPDGGEHAATLAHSASVAAGQKALELLALLELLEQAGER